MLQTFLDLPWRGLLQALTLRGRGLREPSHPHPLRRRPRLEPVPQGTQQLHRLSSSQVAVRRWF